MAGGVETLKSAFSAVAGTVKFAGKVIGKVPLAAGVSTLAYTFGIIFDTMKTLFSDLQTAYAPAPP